MAFPEPQSSPDGGYFSCFVSLLPVLAFGLMQTLPCPVACGNLVLGQGHGLRVLSQREDKGKNMIFGSRKDTKASGSSW